MRKLSLRDALATLVVAAVVVPFVGYSIRGSMPLLQDPRGMAGIGLGGAVITFLVFGSDAFGFGRFGRMLEVLAIATLGLGAAALIVETSWALLVPMVAGIVLVWVLAMLHDAGYLAPHVVHHR